MTVYTYMKKYGIYQDLYSEFYMTHAGISYIYVENVSKILHFNDEENYAEILIFSHTFNGDISFIHEYENIKAIIFGTSFNSSIDNLPDNIELICFPFNSHFNLSVDNLNINLKAIIFGKNFDKSTKLLPPGCECILRNIKAFYD